MDLHFGQATSTGRWTVHETESEAHGPVVSGARPEKIIFGITFRYCYKTIATKRFSIKDFCYIKNFPELTFLPGLYDLLYCWEASNALVRCLITRHPRIDWKDVRTRAKVDFQHNLTQIFKSYPGLSKLLQGGNDDIRQPFRRGFISGV